VSLEGYFWSTLSLGVFVFFACMGGWAAKRRRDYAPVVLLGGLALVALYVIGRASVLAGLVAAALVAGEMLVIGAYVNGRS